MFKNNIKITLQQDMKNIRVNLNPKNDVNLNLCSRLTLKYVEPNHAKLDNLDYENSGHTGFMPAKLSLLPKTQNSVQNRRLSLAVYDSTSEETTNIDFDDVRKRIIKTSDSRSQTDQKGQYIFLEINKEEN